MKHVRLSPQLLRDPIHFCALGFGAGLSPWAPGTAGTLIAVPIVIWLGSYGSHIHSAATVLLCLVGIFLCDASAKRLGVHDHPGIVWDEIAGFSITMLAVPHTWYWLLAGFVVFRFLDIVKPWPIREADHRLRGGLGIMLDDMMAGAFGACLLYGFKAFI